MSSRPAIPKRNEPKFKLPLIIPEKYNLNAETGVTKCETALSIPKDNSRLNPELDIIIEQKKRDELAKNLTRKRLYANQIREKLDMQWKQLEQNELVFQRTIIAHDRFLKRNLEKRERALAKIQTDMELTKKRERDIRMLHQQHEFFDAVLNKMRLEIKNHSIYEDFLNALIQQSESVYKSTFDLLMKYESLEQVRQHCAKRQTEEMATTILLHDENVEFFRLKDIVLIGLRNDLNNLRCKFEDIYRKNLVTEGLITSIVNRTNLLKTEVLSCRFMIDFIYRYICRRRKMAKGDFSLSDVETKIDILKNTLNVWSRILAPSESMKKKRNSKLPRKSNTVKTSITQEMFMWKKKEPKKQSLEEEEEKDKMKKPSN